MVVTRPRLPDGTPFPTTYYLTCPRAVAACSSLESQGLMAEMNHRLSRDHDLALAYRRAHEQYLPTGNGSIRCRRSPMSAREGCPIG